ncbi:MAG: hypothetical protein ACFFBP_00675 [Promethearchaeota archaeon]
MSISELYSKGCIQKKIYSNGQLAIYINDVDGQPFAELSVSKDCVFLEQDEFILKDYSENADLVEKLANLEVIELTDRFVLVGSHVCPICKILI